MKIKLAIGLAGVLALATIGVAAATHTTNTDLCHIQPAAHNETADPAGDWVRLDMLEGYEIDRTGGIGRRSDLAVFVQNYPHCSVDQRVWNRED